MGRGACGLENYVIPDAQGSFSPEGDDDLFVVMGEEGIVSGGVFDHGMQEDARRVMGVLGKRLGRLGLTLHPDKTRLLPFRRPPAGRPAGKV